MCYSDEFGHAVRGRLRFRFLHRRVRRLIDMEGGVRLFAHCTGLSRSSLHRWASGRAVPRFGPAVRLAHCLRVSLESLCRVGN